MEIDKIKINKRFRKDLGDIKSLADSIEDVGLLHPIVINQNNELVAGRRRLEAFKLLGRTEIPVTQVNLDDIVKAEHDENVIRKDFLPSEAVAIWEDMEKHKGGRGKTLLNFNRVFSCKNPKNRREIASEITGLSTVTLSKAKQIIDNGNEEDVIKMDKTGNVDKVYREVKLRQRIQKIKDAAKNDEPLPSGITLLEGDLNEQIHKIENNSIDLLLIDPPYGVLNNHDWDAAHKSSHENLFSKWLEIINPKLKKEHIGFIFMDARRMHKISQVLELTHSIHNTLIWVRKNMSKGRFIKNKFVSSYEAIFYFGSKSLNLPEQWGDEIFDSFEYAVPQSNFKDIKIHPTQKPLELIKRLVSLGSREGEIVLDCFAGSGTTGVACKELNRKCILIEKEKEYIQMIKGRLSI